MLTCLQVVSTALRSLRRAPGFAAVCVALLAVGLGANVVMISVLRSILWRPLPYPDAERLVALTAQNAPRGLAMPALSASDFRDLRARASSYSALGASRPDFATLVREGGDEPVQLVVANVTPEFFAVFGRAPVRGRVFRAEEFSFAAPRAVMLSEGAWRRWFAGGEAVVGSTIRIDDETVTVIGVMPADFREPEFVEAWRPFPEESPEYWARDSRYWATVGRLASGATVASAQAEAAVIAAALAQEYPATNRGWEVRVIPLLEQRVGGVRGSLWLLAGAVGLVLAIMCVNLANLLLARGVARQTEWAVHLTLGARPAQLAATVLVEGVLLALAGGALGAALATVGLPVVAQSLPVGWVPRAHHLGVDGGALLFAVVAAVGTGVVFGALPAWQVWRAPLRESLQAGGARTATSRRSGRVQGALVVGQLALTLVVLGGAASLWRGLLQLQQTAPGFEPRGLMTVRLAPAPAKWRTVPELAAYYDRALAAVEGLPGVAAAAIDSSAPLAGITLRFPVEIEGRAREEGGGDEAVFHAVSPDYFRTLRLALQAGRLLEARDDARAPKACVVNRALAERMFPGEDPIGRRLRIVPWLLAESREIVGVVGDTRQENLADPPPPAVYVPHAQSPWFFATLLVRGENAPPAPGAVLAALRAVDPTASFAVDSLEKQIAQTATVPRLRAQLLAVFGGVSLALSALGVYATTAFTVRQGWRDLGVRLALGATPAAVAGEVVWRSARLAVAGVVLGVLGALGLHAVLRGAVAEMPAMEPVLLVVAAGALGVTTVLAAVVPASSAARVDPALVLRAE